MGLAHADQPLAGAQAPLIFAAASLKPALDAITASPAGQAQAQVQLSYAASSQLARQIDHGAPADVFIS
ncbi:MAG: substrate-binding domain-containing protein, partial [Lysobacterales bacterium]